MNTKSALTEAIDSALDVCYTFSLVGELDE